MLFTRDAAAGPADGTITLTFRAWTKPQAKVRGRYRTWGLLLEVDDVRRVDPTKITEAEARRPVVRRRTSCGADTRNEGTMARSGVSSSDTLGGRADRSSR